MSLDNLPVEWFATTLDQIAEWGSGGTPSRKNSSYYGGNVPWIKTGDLGEKYVTQATEFITDEAVKNSSAKYFRKGSVIMAMYGATIGKTSILGIDATTNQACAVGTPVATSTEFLYYFLRNEKDSFIAKGKGGAQPNISQQIIKAHTVYLPALAEQQEIVRQLDVMLTQVEQIKARLDAIPAILKKFRQSVLADAVSGKLTEEWRNTNETSDVRVFVDKSYSKKQGNVRIRGITSWDDEFQLDTLPENWAWIENYKLAKDTTNAICAGPFGTIFKAKDFRDRGVPIVFLRHVKEGGFNQNKPTFMDQEVWKELHQEYSIKGGELLVTKLGDPPGECCIYPENIGVAMVTPDVLKMEVDVNVVNKKYLMYFFNSIVSKEMVRKAAFGATRLRIDIALFKKFPIPLPPLTEQDAIVETIDSLLGMAEKVENTVQSAQKRVNLLTQSILAKAFSGELTAEWREQNQDLITGVNSAESLLAKIQAEREASKPVKKTRKKKEV